jgi:hypothetical protein
MRPRRGIPVFVLSVLVMALSAEAQQNMGPAPKLPTPVAPTAPATQNMQSPAFNQLPVFDQNRVFEQNNSAIGAIPQDRVITTVPGVATNPVTDQVFVGDAQQSDPPNRRELPMIPSPTAPKTTVPPSVMSLSGAPVSEKPLSVAFKAYTDCMKEAKTAAAKAICRLHLQANAD